MWQILISVITLVTLYILLNDYKICQTPPEAVKHSPKRWTEADLARYASEKKESVDLAARGYLGEKTGRRYIVVGGAGFLGGWVVLHLIERGEKPQNIRILDISFPSRPDLAAVLSLPGPNKPTFIQTDISDPESVRCAFETPWPEMEGELTVFHTAANIRFYERHPKLLKHSLKVNYEGTKHIVEAAREAGATILIYTSSGSIGVRSTRFLLWPWEKTVKYFTQHLDDEKGGIQPTRNSEYFSNYAISKHLAEKYVCSAHQTKSSRGNPLKTGCIRPCNGIMGTGDTLIDMYARINGSPTWIKHILSSFVYVENCSIGILAYERALLDPHKKVGGESYCIADSGPPPTYDEVYRALIAFSAPELSVKIPHLSPTLMLLISYVVQALYLGRHLLPYPINKLFPSFGVGNIKFLQPSMFDLTLVHLICDDSRARKELGYKAAWDTLGAVWETARGRAEKRKGFFVVNGPLAGTGSIKEEDLDTREGGGVGIARPQVAVGEAIERVTHS